MCSKSLLFWTNSSCLDGRASKLDLLLHIVLIQRKRLAEHACELADLALERLAVLPRLAGVQDLGGHVLARSGNREAKDVKGGVLGLCERAVMDGVDDRAGVLERAAPAVAILAASPAGVDEPAVDLVL
jgi:hypothetical protein